MLDVLIRGAAIVDGTGGPAFGGDLAIQAGRIVGIGAVPRAAEARQTVDAAGLVAAPGFIDIHTHADIALLARPEQLPAVMQGVTTQVAGNCGLGFAPCDGGALATQREYLCGLFGDDAGVDWTWDSVGSLLDRYAVRGTGTNVAYLVPHGPLRVAVMGMAARPATPDERARMVALAEGAMADGALGLSTGLWYAPMCHADAAELVALCRAAGFLATHQRSYGAGLFAALEETLAIAQEAGVPVQLSHLQLNGPRSRGRAAEVLTLLEKARERGVDVTWDSYPYCAGSTLVQALLPAWATDGGPQAILRRLADPGSAARIEQELAASDLDWAATVLAGAHSAVNRPYEGLSFEGIAARRGLSPAAYVCRVLVEDDLQACYIMHDRDEADVQAVLQHPAQMVGSDGLHLRGKTHPRLYGTFPRVLGEYVRERRALPLEEAVRKMTAAPAERLGLRDRGRLAPGMAADVVLFDPAAVRDLATYEDPLRFPEGIPHVFVNGIATKRDGEPTHALPGQVLRKP